MQENKQEELYKSVKKYIQKICKEDEQNADEKVLELLKKLPITFLSYQCLANKSTIGMYLTGYKKLNKSLNFILEKNELLLQQDKNGKNIGMWAAESKLEEAVKKALENKEASLQQNKVGWNIGMYAAESKLEEAVKKALDNKEASLQQDKNGKTIKDYTVKYGIIKKKSKKVEQQLATKLEKTKTEIENLEEKINLIAQEIAKENNCNTIIKKTK